MPSRRHARYRLLDAALTGAVCQRSTQSTRQRFGPTSQAAAADDRVALPSAVALGGAANGCALRVLVTGASGLLGSWLLRTSPGSVEVVAAAWRGKVDWPQVVRVDLREAERTRRLLATVRPDLVVHAAYARDRASIVAATGSVVAGAGAVGASVVLLSTDAVFSGDGSPCAEDDDPRPVWDYGRWKVEAERMVAASAGAVVRLPLLVSLEPADASTRRIRAASATGERVGWFAGERRQPADAEQIARAIWQIAQLPSAEHGGFWHLAGAERITRRELGTRIAQALDVPDPGIDVPAPPTDTRPRDLHLTDARARTRIGWRPTPVLHEPRRATSSEAGDVGVDGCDALLQPPARASTRLMPMRSLEPEGPRPRQCLYPRWPPQTGRRRRSGYGRLAADEQAIEITGMCGRADGRQRPQPHRAARRTSTVPYTASMAATKMLRVSDRTHDGFRREAERRGATIDEVAAAALRALRQKEMGEQLAAPLEDDEAEWLDAPLR